MFKETIHVCMNMVHYWETRPSDKSFKNNQIWDGREWMEAFYMNKWTGGHDILIKGAWLVSTSATILNKLWPPAMESAAFKLLCSIQSQMAAGVKFKH